MFLPKSVPCRENMGNRAVSSLEGDKEISDTSDSRHCCNINQASQGTALGDSLYRLGYCLGSCRSQKYHSLMRLYSLNKSHTSWKHLFPQQSDGYTRLTTLPGIK